MPTKHLTRKEREGKLRASLAAQPPVVLVDVEVISGPDMSEFTARVAEVRQTMIGRQIDLAYDLVELGWIFLQGKAVIEHGNTGNTNAAKNTTETVSRLNLGFSKWLHKEIPGIEDRTAENYMNAARNLGLTVDSTIEEVRFLRKQRAIGDRRMRDLYLPPGVSAERECKFYASVDADTFKRRVIQLQMTGCDKRQLMMQHDEKTLKNLSGRLRTMLKIVESALKDKTQPKA